MANTMDWVFPLIGPHNGIPFGNGRTGMLIRGKDNVLRITVSRADLWDHRGGMSWTAKQNYRDIRRALEKKDSGVMAEIFRTDTEGVEGQPSRPSIVPLGRLELTFKKEVCLQDATLDFSSGVASIRYRKAGKEYGEIKAFLSPLRDVFVLETQEDLQIRAVPSYELVPDMAKYSFPKPRMLKVPGGAGWIQDLPVDPGCGVLLGRMPDGSLCGIVERGEKCDELEKSLFEKMDYFQRENNWTALKKESVHWWREFFAMIPDVSLSNKTLERRYYFGIYLFKSFANALGGVPAGLQGPWIEEHRFPPWSGDYHFNINVQMCYSPALPSGCTAELLLLFDMVFSWSEQLRRNAEYFIGIKDGYMLPHAVDDHCVCMGGFWTGILDHGCTAWVASMMYQYYLYTSDINFLRDKAFDFMQGAFNVYYAMMEKKKDGSYALPLSVSPEYRGSNLDAWGENASFQLAAAHNLCNNLISAASELGVKTDPRWLEIQEKLPLACVGKFDGHGNKMIDLWKGCQLEESHRHHSHLAGIMPFDVLDANDPEWRSIIDFSYHWWTLKGMGLWSGWCISWAAIINSHLGNGRMTEQLLETWERVFTNKGHASLHNAEFPGFTVMGNSLPSRFAEQKAESQDASGEIMQCDGAMGVVNAIQDMLLHTRRGVLYICPGVPDSWDNAEFTDMPTPCGVNASAKMSYGRLSSLVLTANRNTVVRLASPWKTGASIKLSSAKKAKTDRNSILELALKTGEVAVLTSC